MFAWRAHQTNQLHQQIEEANARAAEWELVYVQASRSWVERAHTYIEKDRAQGEMLADLEEGNAALASDLRESEATVLELTETVVGLNAELDESHSTATREDSSTYRIDLSESVRFDSGGRFQVEGRVVLTAIPERDPTVAADLTARGSFPLTIVLSRLDSEEIRVDAFTGDPRLVVSYLDVRRIDERGAGEGSWVSDALGALGGIASSPISTAVVALAGYGFCTITR